MCATIIFKSLCMSERLKSMSIKKTQKDAKELRSVIAANNIMTSAVALALLAS